MKPLKHYLHVIAFGVCLGLFLVLVQHALQMDTDTFLHNYYLIAGMVLVAAVLGNLGYNGYYRRKMRKAAALLEAGDPQGYIEAVERLRQKARGQNLQNLLQLNLSAGYCDLKRFDRAIALLEPLFHERLTGDVLMVHRLNLCICYFYSGQGKKALALYEESEEIFDRFRPFPIYGGNLAVLDIFAAMERGRYKDARAMLENARGAWNRPRLQEDYRYIAERLEEKTAEKG